MLPWLFISKFDENPNKMPAQLLTKLQWQTFLFNRFRVSAYCCGVWLRKTAFSWVMWIWKDLSIKIYTYFQALPVKNARVTFFSCQTLLYRRLLLECHPNDRPSHPPFSLFLKDWRRKEFWSHMVNRDLNGMVKNLNL